MPESLLHGPRSAPLPSSTSLHQQAAYLGIGEFLATSPVSPGAFRIFGSSAFELFDLFFQACGFSRLASFLRSCQGAALSDARVLFQFFASSCRIWFPRSLEWAVRSFQSDLTLDFPAGKNTPLDLVDLLLGQRVESNAQARGGLVDQVAMALSGRNRSGKL